MRIRFIPRNIREVHERDGRTELGAAREACFCNASGGAAGRAGVPLRLHQASNLATAVIAYTIDEIAADRVHLPAASIANGERRARETRRPPGATPMAS
jgi:hypothetical protein